MVRDGDGAGGCSTECMEGDGDEQTMAQDSARYLPANALDTDGQDPSLDTENPDCAILPFSVVVHHFFRRGLAGRLSGRLPHNVGDIRLHCSPLPVPIPIPFPST